MTTIPGTPSRFSDIAVRKFSGDKPLRHSDLGLSSTKASALLVGSAWAPTSPRPIRVTIDLISGKAVRSLFSTRVVVSAASVKEIDGAMVTRSRTSPSSSEGVNSDPRRDPASPPATRRMAARAIAAKRWRTKNPAAWLTVRAIHPGRSSRGFLLRRMTPFASDGAISAA